MSLEISIEEKYKQLVEWTENAISFITEKYPAKIQKFINKNPPPVELHINYKPKKSKESAQESQIQSETIMPQQISYNEIEKNHTVQIDFIPTLSSSLPSTSNPLFNTFSTFGYNNNNISPFFLQPPPPTQTNSVDNLLHLQSPQFQQFQQQQQQNQEWRQLVEQQIQLQLEQQQQQIPLQQTESSPSPIIDKIEEEKHDENEVKGKNKKQPKKRRNKQKKTNSTPKEETVEKEQQQNEEITKIQGEERREDELPLVELEKENIDNRLEISQEDDKDTPLPSPIPLTSSFQNPISIPSINTGERLSCPLKSHFVRWIKLDDKNPPLRGIHDSMPYNHIRKPTKECSILYNPFNYDDEEEEEEDPESGTDLSDDNNEKEGDEEDEEGEDIDDEEDEKDPLIVDDEENVDSLFNRKREIKQEISEFYMDELPPYSSLLVKFIGKSFEKTYQKYNKINESLNTAAVIPFEYKADKKLYTTLNSVINAMINKLEVEERKERRKSEFEERQRKKQEEKEKRRKEQEEFRERRSIQKEREKKDKLINYACKLCVRSLVSQVARMAKKQKKLYKITIMDGIETGVFKPGKNVLVINYMNKTIMADLLENGKIRHAETGNIFNTPSSYSLQMKRNIQQDKRSDDGWKSVLYKGKLLEEYKREIKRLKKLMGRDDNYDDNNSRKRKRGYNNNSSDEDDEEDVSESDDSEDNGNDLDDLIVTKSNEDEEYKPKRRKIRKPKRYRSDDDEDDDQNNNEKDEKDDNEEEEKEESVTTPPTQQQDEQQQQDETIKMEIENQKNDGDDEKEDTGNNTEGDKNTPKKTKRKLSRSKSKGRKKAKTENVQQTEVKMEEENEENKEENSEEIKEEEIEVKNEENKEENKEKSKKGKKSKKEKKKEEEQPVRRSTRIRKSRVPTFVTDDGDFIYLSNNFI